MGRMIGEKWELFECSPQAKKKFLYPQSVDDAVKGGEIPKNAKYPFMAMNVGECFVVPFSHLEVNTKQNLQASITAYHKRVARKFCLISHKEQALIEVARIA